MVPTQTLSTATSRSWSAMVPMASSSGPVDRTAAPRASVCQAVSPSPRARSWSSTADGVEQGRPPAAAPPSRCGATPTRGPLSRASTTIPAGPASSSGADGGPYHVEHEHGPGTYCAVVRVPVITKQPLVLPDDLQRWAEADRTARPRRLARLRAKRAEAGVDGYFGVRRENTRYLTGFALGDGEEKVAGNSGWFLVTPDEVVLLADSRYAEQAAAECPDARIADVYHDLPARWPEIAAGRRRVAAEAGFIAQATWARLVVAAPSTGTSSTEGD